MDLKAMFQQVSNQGLQAKGQLKQLDDQRTALLADVNRIEGQMMMLQALIKEQEDEQARQPATPKNPVEPPAPSAPEGSTEEV